MKIELRQANLIEIVRRKGKVSVEELAGLLQASKETIRRDLAQLSDKGKILKVHGGARIPRFMGEGSFKQRMSENVDAKLKIAKSAAELFEPGETLFVDTGSTTLLFIEAIANGAELTIVTNSTEIARTIATVGSTSRAFLLGGQFSADNSQTVGAMAATHARAFRAHHCVLTVAALDARSGAMDFDIEEAQIARAMIEQSEMVTILADSSKLGSVASFEVCPLMSIDRLVTDSIPSPNLQEALKAAGVDVVLSAKSAV
ncbi:MAG: DeoR/GlpR family DNA-binding transcription regulator [Paracoccaceae bacterium]